MLPTFAELADPFDSIGRVTDGDGDRQGPDARNSVAGALVQRPRAAIGFRYSTHVVLPLAAHRRREPDHRRLRRPLPDDHGPQGARRLPPAWRRGSSAVQFDPTRHRAIWPSTEQLRPRWHRDQPHHGVAGRARSSPEGMSPGALRLAGASGASHPADDIIRTSGTESNVKEIYDACNELAQDPTNFVLNQFCEFGNHLAHYEVTGRAFATRVGEHVAAHRCPGFRVASPAFVSATGSAGTIAAGDRLKDPFGSTHRGRRGAGVPDDARERLRRRTTSRASATSTSR